MANTSEKLVTLSGECFEWIFQGEKGGIEASDQLFKLTDLVRGRGERLVSLCRTGQLNNAVPSYKSRIEAVTLNTIRRAFDSGVLSFDSPNERQYKKLSLQTADFEKQPLRNDHEILQFIIHKAYWLSYRYPMPSPSVDVLAPVPFDEAVDLEYLGAEPADVRRGIQRLKSRALLEKIMEGHGRPTDRLLVAYESGDFASLGLARSFSTVPTFSLRTENDQRFARLAIEEARKSISEQDGRPHPRVGAVVVKDGQVLSAAHRGEAAGNHAEFIALEKKLPDVAAAGATVYTTLEPCTTRNHPKVPCAERLVERKVARVVIGMLDPDPRITGRGQRKLRSANIVTDFFPHELMTEVEELNREFTRHYEHQDRMAQTQPRLIPYLTPNVEDDAVNFLDWIRKNPNAYVRQYPSFFSIQPYLTILQSEGLIEKSSVSSFDGDVFQLTSMGQRALISAGIKLV
jgi:pyrimidine deaminase RibD-like protein